MDEAEKYKQRLEAIAEKRRLQEEQERARREMEDERLRLQQLKRKSLRDQWLMEGAPLSPTSLDSLSSRSPLWGFQTAETNQQTEKSQSESQQLAEEQDKVQMEVGQMEKETLVEAKDAGKETTQDDIVQNGENNAATSDEAQVKTNQDPLLNETTISLTNGTKDLKANTNHSALDPSTQSTTNGPICTTEVVLGLQLEPGLSISDSEAEADKTNIFNNNEEDTEDSVVMRAQRVMITDEEEDVSENLNHEKGQQETTQSEKSPKQEEESVKGGQKIEDLQMTTQPEESETTEATINAQPASGDADGINTNENTDEETKVDVQGQSASLELDFTASAQEASTVAPVPVYSENKSSSFSPEAEGSPEGAEAAIKVQDPDTTPGQFQEVPLTDAQENQKTEAGVGEQEPLLEQSKAHNTQAAPQGTSGPGGTVQGEDIKTPKHKSCQCCTIM